MYSSEFRSDSVQSRCFQENSSAQMCSLLYALRPARSRRSAAPVSGGLSSVYVSVPRQGPVPWQLVSVCILGTQQRQPRCGPKEVKVSPTSALELWRGFDRDSDKRPIRS